jgi:cobalt-zinc-cadmium efflux system membrane fusion protein
VSLARTILVLMAVGTGVILLWGCGPGSDAAAAAAPVAPTGEPGVLVLEPAMAKVVRVETVETVPLPTTLKAYGKIQFNEDHTGVVLAPLPGLISRLTVKVGDAVRKGDPLFMMSSRDITSAVGDYLDSRKDLTLSEKTYAMTKDLFENHAAAAISLRQAENDLAKARGKVERTQASLKALGVDHQGEDIISLVPVRSPLQGTVIERKVTEGQFVTGDGTALLTIADLSSVWIVADLFERDLPKVNVGQRAEVATIAYPKERFTGLVERISDVVDPATRTLKVRLLVPNTDGRLKPEMFASVLLYMKEAEPSLTIPSRAAFIEGSRHFVYVELSTGRFQRRRVEVQPGPDGRLKVVEGIAATDRVACEDVLLLRAQDTSN